MRLWSIHPKYLDTKGLVALWREGLLAKHVLEGKTKGYKHHPQLDRFKERDDAIELINAYLTHVLEESQSPTRKFKFNSTKITRTQLFGVIPISKGQIEFEFQHLLDKLKNRDPLKYATVRIELNNNLEHNGKEYQLSHANVTHPLFIPIDGMGKATWEKATTDGYTTL